MFQKGLIWTCALFLMGSFTSEIILSISSSDPIVLSQDADPEIEKEEVKEASTLQDHVQIPGANRSPVSTFTVCESGNDWKNPVIDITSPPPR